VRLGVPRVVWGGAALAALVAIVLADPAERLRAFKAPPAEQGEAGAVAVGAHLTGGGGSGRWQFWDAALEQFSRHPVAGGGAGSFEPWWAQHGSLDWFVRNAHSLWLETLGELGLLGLLLVAGAFATGLAVGATRVRDSSAAERATTAALLAVVLAFVVGAAIDWVWQLPVVPIVALLALGVLTGPAGTRDRVRSAPSVSLGPRAAVILAAWVVICIQAIPFLASQQVIASQRAAERDDVRAALERALSAEAIQPWAATPRLQLALVREQAGQIDLARRDIADAIERDSSDWRLHVVATRLAIKAGDIAAARHSLARARQLNPRSRLLREPEAAGVAP
jgi:O-antigen ligase